MPMTGAAYPKFYAHWLSSSEARTLYDSPQESRPVACDTCEMLKPKGLTRDLGPFKPNLKCCTFQPFLPSFTLGALLKNDDLSVIERYFRKSKLTPLGAIPLEAEPTSICETGKHEKDGCSFLAKGQCTIHEFRPSTCAGYVCRSSDGASGLKSWNRWEQKIAKFEWTLAHLTAFELGYTLDDVTDTFANDDEAKIYYQRALKTALQIPFSTLGE